MTSRAGISDPAYLLYHLPHFPLLALKHVVQVVDLLPQPSHFLFQVSSPGDEEQMAEARGKDALSTRSQTEPWALGLHLVCCPLPNSAVLCSKEQMGDRHTGNITRDHVVQMRKLRLRKVRSGKSFWIVPEGKTGTSREMFQGSSSYVNAGRLSQY